MNYDAFLDSKRFMDTPTGLDKDIELNPMLFDFQRDVVRWALKRGRAAIFADCGLGKTPMQLEWARHVPGNVLILAPLAVAQQTIREGIKFGIEVKYARKQADADSDITVTNYEMIDHFDADKFQGIVLDESSILKSYDGKFRTKLIDKFKQVSFKLACTATPAPNDYMELGNHSEFLGVLTRMEMLTMFFVHDSGDVGKWRLKGHAESEYWKWLCSWAVMIRKPSDLGYKDNAFILPHLNYHDHRVEVDNDGTHLFPMEAQTLPERLQARRSSIDKRVAECANLVNNSNDFWLIWCNLNKESEQLRKAIPGSVEVKGSDSLKDKEHALTEFSAGNIRVLITKPSIAGFGMNWQHCNQVAFVGLSDSYEQFYQAVRRCWRFGQTRPVDCHIITANIEGAVVNNIKRKERDAEAMALNMVKHMQDMNRENIQGLAKETEAYHTDHVHGNFWDLYRGDCVDMINHIENDSIHYSIFSPPFASLYTYTNSERDMGNCKNEAEFLSHLTFLIRHLFRVIMPGRLLSFHCMNLLATKTRDGFIGVKDFRGDLIRLFQDAGFIYHSEVCIWKDPLVQATRTKTLGLAHKQISKDSAMCGQGLPDYLVTMRKPGDNPEPIAHGRGFETYIGEKDAPNEGHKTDNHRTNKYSHKVWQRYASPVWMDIRQTETLQYRMAREHKDEKHICPLQLDVIRRGLELWSNEGDLILSPFAGIGSEGYCAIEMGRRFVGIELKESYFNQAVNNLKHAHIQKQDLFTEAGHE
jgi:superfamily II DNA or RNA helicase